MVVLADVVLALLFALVFLIIFGVAVGAARGGKRRPGPDTVAFFLLFFLLIWAGGTWIQPAGPSILGVYWLPFFVVGVVATLLLAIAATVWRRPSPDEEVAGELPTGARPLTKTFGVFFWILTAFLMGVIIVGYGFAW